MKANHDALARPANGENHPIHPERGSLRRIAARALQPVPIDQPTVDPKLTQLGSIERAGEVLRFSVRRFEYWLSPRGTLREWVRLNLKLALFLGIATLVLTPVLTMLFRSVASLTTILIDIAKNLVLLPAWIGTALLIIAGVGLLWRLIFGR